MGSAIKPDLFATEPEYKTVAAQEFNSVTSELKMKWDPIEVNRSHPNYDSAEIIMKFAKDNGMKVRGHVLLWHQAVPKWVEALANDSVKLHKVMVKHIK